MMENTIECPREGVLSHLDVLEMEALKLSRRQQLSLQQQSRVDDLRIMVEKLRAQRDQLKARVKTTMSLQQLKAVIDQGPEECDDDGEEEGCSGSMQLHLLLLKARQTQVKYLLQAHHVIGGYDVTETRRGQGVCVSIATAFEGCYLETYNLELDVTRTVRICRHNIPPFIPLEKLVQENLQTDLSNFLSTLSQHLNAFAGRRQQVRLIQAVLRGSVKVMESNALFNTVVVMCTELGENHRAVLCTLEYTDLSRYLPTKVTIESEDKALPSSPQWKENQSLLLETPAHTALQALKEKGQIA
ncbi:hypothetical protein AAFF_G00411050 [Aldrovandia affinis]|uniref:Centromere protein O n=1 Tax=Aldrovandia affinis TaxID=143900 RepID=A0AAD7SBR2_9TELE|nr:hypothetical protein AAFF_G00411050 [Aldrovandia affinis]